MYNHRNVPNTTMLEKTGPERVVERGAQEATEVDKGLDVTFTSALPIISPFPILMVICADTRTTLLGEGQSNMRARSRVAISSDNVFPTRLKQWDLAFLRSTSETPANIDKVKTSKQQEPYKQNLGTNGRGSELLEGQWTKTQKCITDGLWNLTNKI
ncbi:hypothetical protein J6590_069329 [Homalodisca vitripennis]|nr:hypothetical protein J6590_069329 [Homalodisca vitripennis]